jgi:hypothetical protein
MHGFSQGIGRYVNLPTNAEAAECGAAVSRSGGWWNDQFYTANSLASNATSPTLG